MIKGSITKRGDSYRVRVSSTDNGQRKQISRTAHTPQEAEKLRTKLMNQKYEGTLSKQPKGTLEQYLTRWLTEYVEPNLSPNTVKSYTNIVTVHLVPGLGKIALKNIKAEHLQTYYADKLKTLNSTTVRHHHTLLHRAFKQAVLLDLMTRNPADAVTPPRYHKAEMHILNENEVDLVLRSANPEYYSFFYLALFSGLRRGELLALRWSDVNLPMAEMSVSRSVVSLEGGGYIFKDTKTAKSRRTVALSPSTCQVLSEHLDKQMANKKRLEIKFHNDDLIFSHDYKNPFNGNAVSMVWRNLVRRLGLKGVRFHDCRHTMATAMLSAGVHPKIVQERLGHSSIAITLDTYSHVAPGLQHTAANKMDEVFNTANRDHFVTIGNNS
jgi:integrase